MTTCRCCMSGIRVLPRVEAVVREALIGCPPQLSRLCDADEWYPFWLTDRLCFHVQARAGPASFHALLPPFLPPPPIAKAATYLLPVLP